MAVEIVRSQPEHLQAMEIRPEDRAEFWAAAMADPKDVLLPGLRSAWTCLVDGEPVAIFGVTPPAMLGGTAVPWLVGSVHLNPRLLLSPAREVLDGWDFEHIDLSPASQARNQAVHPLLGTQGNQVILIEQGRAGPDKTHVAF